jgi:hypothetical protein
MRLRRTIARTGFILAAVSAMVVVFRGADPAQTTRTQHFDRDPQWDGHNNRLGAERQPVTIAQAFGYSTTRRAGGRRAGEIGGLVTPAAEPALYATTVDGGLSFEKPFHAAGKLSIPRGGGNVLVGFFNRNTINEWRTPNSVVLRLNARGDEGFHLHVEYCTARWRAGADVFGTVDPASGKKVARLFAPGASHDWSIRYDPAANEGGGAVVSAVDGDELVVNLDAGHKSDGATFNRFGILNVIKSFDGGGEVWLDDLDVNGAAHSFDADPKWDAFNNRREYETRNVRPWFNFGFSPTGHAGGAAAGEIGGLLFRGDQRYPDRLACYGDVLDGELSMDDPLEARGRIVLRRGVTDSSVLLGFYHGEASMRVADAQVSGWPENFLGVAIEGPSREGFLFYPAYGTAEEGTGEHAARGSGDALPPHILPDGVSHAWSLRYDPAANDGRGRMTVTLDDKSLALDLPDGHRQVGATFNRFGFVTTHIDGNGQEVFVDDLTYTASRR